MNVHKRWSRTARYLALVVVLAGLTRFLLAIRALAGPLVIAALLAYALYPAVTWLETRTKLGHRLSVAIVYVLFLIAWAAILIAFAPIVVDQATKLSLELQSIRSRLDSVPASPLTFLGFDLPLDELLGELDAALSQVFRPDRVFRVLRAATSNLVWVLVILVTTYYLLRDWERLREWLIRLAPEAYRSDIRRLHREVKDIWHAYLRGQLLVMLVVGVLTGLVSAAVGLPGAAALGLLAGALDLIPSFGPTATAVVAAVVAWFEGSTYLPLPNAWFTVLVIGLYSLVQLVENVWLQPRIMGRALRLNSGLVFVAVVGALTLGGALVALIIVPLIGTAGVVGRYVHRSILGLPPWHEPVSARTGSVNHVGDGDDTEAC
jgi:predicted PurR-regulated permease PerM